MENKKRTTEDDLTQIDSPINTEGAKGNEGKAKSLTITEAYDVDPNTVPDKPSFSDNDEAKNREKFDGERDRKLGN